MATVRRIFVEKKEGFDVEARAVLADLRENLSLAALERVRILNRYDISGISDEEYALARNLIFSEPPVDNAYDEQLCTDGADAVFAVEYLPGQFDQRAASCSECISILTEKERPEVRSAKLYILSGKISPDELTRIKDYLINPVEAREASLEKPETLDMSADIPADVATVDGFCDMSAAESEEFLGKMGFAMDADDLAFCREYFKNTEKRDPTVTELRMIDTYWSDHCRHTTFSTHINSVEIPDGKYADVIRASYEEYKRAKAELYSPDRSVCLMNMATIIVKQLKARGLLKEIDESEEINACSIVVPVDIDGREEPWLIMFKNETHNHPTEIEPFGGAATCLGGAIRDPLSGRSYVYQAMRVTGSGDPRKTLAETLPGKLMQRKITKGAASGYSSYGNQIGLATGQVSEIYHEGYVAKRMEIGAVIAAAPKENVVREAPEAGDVIILLGGRTGRDGIGGATGSSKAHNEQSVMTCGSEVQKGNPPVERKIQRLMRNGDVTRLIKRCNDFGAGGVSVAIGELADGLVINLDKVPKKYDGLDGTELAISESQERMAVCVRKSDAEKFIEYSNSENLEATIVAEVTDTNRLVMTWRGKTICDISRDFLNTNGAVKNTDVEVVLPEGSYFAPEKVADTRKKWLDTLSSLNVCSQKGLCEMFDSTIGSNTVLMPFAGLYQLTPSDGMAAKVPVLGGKTNTATIMTYGYDPYLSAWSPYHGAAYAVVESVSKAVALGADYKRIYLTFQEYFERLGSDKKRWGKPFAALLGAYRAELALGIAAIGGKDSMSGSFNELDVPPTLTSFAVAPAKADKIISQEFKKAGSRLVLYALRRDENDLPDFDALKAMYDKVHALIQSGCVLSSMTVKSHGLCECIAKMAFGNMIGAQLNENVTDELLFAAPLGSIVLEVTDGADTAGALEIGVTTADAELCAPGVKLSLAEAAEAWQKPLEKVFPTRADAGREEPETYTCTDRAPAVGNEKFAAPRVFIPAFPGTNCEYDSARAFEDAGAVSDVFVMRNLTADDVTYSLAEMKKRIDNAQIVMLPGGFSGGDEPDGSGKFIATALRNPDVGNAVMRLLKSRDGLMLGICNGFQALIKLGLVPYGEIRDLDAGSPTLTYNTIGRHISRMALTRVCSTASPWFANAAAGDLHSVALSHGEGRFIASPEQVRELAKNGQIATQYVNPDGKATYDPDWNPNGSIAAIEGITSPDGRILGKMGHSERIGENISKNVPFEKNQRLFEAGVGYFK